MLLHRPRILVPPTQNCLVEQPVDGWPLLFIFLRFFICMCVSVCLCVCTGTLLPEASREHWISCCGLGTELMSFERAAGTLNNRSTSLALPSVLEGETRIGHRVLCNRIHIMWFPMKSVLDSLTCIGKREKAGCRLLPSI